MSGLKASFSRKCNNYEDFFLNWQTFLIVTGLSKYLEGFNYSYTAALNICRHENNHDNVFFNNCFFFGRRYLSIAGKRG